MRAPKQVYSDMLKELENAIKFVQNNEERKREICERVDNRTEEDVSPKDVSDILDWAVEEEEGRTCLEKSAQEIADENYPQTDVEQNSPTGKQKIMADGGDLFSERGDRIFYVSFSLFHTALTTVHLTQGNVVGATLTGGVLALSFILYIRNEYNVRVEFKTE